MRTAAADDDAARLLEAGRAVGDAVEGTRSQTLHRGLALLEMIAETPLSLPDVVRLSGLHRSVVYRLLRTLEDHRLVERGADDHYRGGLGLVGLARNLTQDLGAATVAELTSLADDLGMTAFVVLRDGDEALTLFTVAPSTAAAHVTYRPGSRHPVVRGAPGLALLAGAPARVGGACRGRTRSRPGLGLHARRGDLRALVGRLAGPRAAPTRRRSVRGLRR